MTFVLAFLESSKFEAPKQDNAINVLEGMLISVHALLGGRVSISGVDVIVYSWLKVLLEPEKRRISVNNVRAFVFILSVPISLTDFRDPTDLINKLTTILTN